MSGAFWTGKKVLLTGGGGFLGQAVLRQLLRRGVQRDDVSVPRSSTHDLREPGVAESLVRGVNVVIHCAARVGGIGFNKDHPATIFFDNSMMSLRLIDEAYKAGVDKFVGIGSIVEHPEFAPVPYREESIWDGYPDRVNSAYALAKRFALAQSQFYFDQYAFNAIHLLPVKLYGPGMSFEPGSAQVIASLMMKIEHARAAGTGHIELWGRGIASREFLFIDDAAEAVVRAAESYEGREPVNVGSGQEISIAELAATLCRLMDYRGELRWDETKPEGQLRSVADVTRARETFAFVATTSLEEGLRRTIAWYRAGAGAVRQPAGSAVPA